MAIRDHWSAPPTDQNAAFLTSHELSSHGDPLTAIGRQLREDLAYIQRLGLVVLAMEERRKDKHSCERSHFQVHLLSGNAVLAALTASEQDTVKSLTFQIFTIQWLATGLLKAVELY